ncbi:LysM peptidoglycan-binding domain-containing protein [Streptococcus mitis]|uniref:LysM peptidoglycan-binding domain-containing protein n=1 Tax=Streptococcus mitis TaxID=28037 RepID=UPI0021B78BDB|nr:LysM peptidoglycan-binding domain-containing protein [Streptococcus mitis]
MRQTNVRGTLSLRGFRKLRTGAIVVTGVILLGLGFLAPTVSASEQDGVWVARTVAEVKADIQNIDNLSHYTIKWGDTLSAISGATGLSVDSLVEINRIANRDLIFTNNKLYFSEEAFLKDGNTEVKRQRVSIDNSGSCQSYEVETKTDTVTGEQTTTVKQTTPVVVETGTPAVSVPKSETSVSVAPKVEEPATPALKEEKPATPAPKVEEPATPAPKAEEPATPAPKEEKPVTPAPKAEEPATPAPKAEEPAATEPKVEEPATPAPKAEEPATPALKAEEPATLAPKEEKPATPAPKAEEPATPAPKAEEPATPAPKAEEPAATEPKVEEPATPAPKAEEPATPAPKAEEPATPAPKEETPATPAPKVEEPSTPAPKEETPATPAPKVEEPSTTPKVEEPSATTPKAEEPAATDPKVEEPATPAPKVEEPSTPEPKTEEEKLLEETKQDSIRENIDAVVNIKLAEIEKIENPDEKEKLKEKLYELRKNAVDDIKNAKDEEEALILTEKHQNIINSLEISGEKYTKPNFDKDNLSNGRNDGTTIEGGSTAIGHGSGEAPSGATQPASAEGTDNSSAPTAQPQPETTSSGTSSFRNAPSVQARARRVARSTSEPDGTVNISYNFAGMPDIHGFLSDPGEDNTVTIPAGTSEAQAKELVKEKIQAKIKDLAARGYYVKNDIIFEQDTTVKNYNYVVTFTKEATGTSGFRMAPAVQPRASRNRRSLEQPAPQKVKVNVFYNFDKMKDIAGFLGDINGTSLEIAEGLSNEQVKAAAKSQVEAKKEELSKRGYTFKEDYVYQANGKDYNYVVTFSKAAK